MSFITRSILPFAVLAMYASASPLDSSWNPLVSRAVSTCSGTTNVSCSSTAAGTCCFEAPGGLLLQTQFWDTAPVTGPTNSWTIHGLWPDHCDGTYDASCDASRVQNNVTQLLTANGQQSLLSYMQAYWQDINGDHQSFWSHEWNKHGTCMSTLKTACLPSGSASGTDAIIYFQKTVDTFKTLPTYTWLAAAGIVPSATQTYTLAAINAALKAGYGYTAQVSCTSKSLNAVAYFYNLKGSLIDGTLVPINMPSFDSSNCPTTGIKYVPKGPTTTSTSNPTTTTTTSGGTGPTSTPPSGGFKLTARGVAGALISGGNLSAQTPATYTALTSGSGFTLTSSKGSCGISSTSQFTCGTGVSSVFNAVQNGGDLILSYNGASTFSSDSEPTGIAQLAVYVGTSRAKQYLLAFTT